MNTFGAQQTPESIRNAPGFLVRRLHQAYTAAWSRHVDTTLTGPQYSVLTAVHCYPAVDQGSLAASVALDRSTMADVCRRLEDRGLIRRETAPGDGRRKLVHLTGAGVQVLSEVDGRVRRLNEDLLAAVAADELTVFVEQLQGLSSHWERVADGQH